MTNTDRRPAGDPTDPRRPGELRAMLEDVPGTVELQAGRPPAPWWATATVAVLCLCALVVAVAGTAHLVGGWL